VANPLPPTMEEGLGTWHPWFDEEGRIIRAVFVPYPCVVPEPTMAEAEAMRAAQSGKRRRRKR
jgi:hypothetical protein